MRFIVCALTFFLLLAIAVGCGNHSDPSTPGNSVTKIQSNPKFVSDENSQRYLWGYYHCMADRETGEVSAVPARTTQLHINATDAMNKTLGLSLKVESGSDPKNGLFQLKVTLIHPYSGKYNLCGFDVKGIFLTTGEIHAGNYRIPGPNDATLLNPDGWSRWWNPTEFPDPGLFGFVPGIIHKWPVSGPPDATVNPYKLFGDGLDPEESVDSYTSISLTDPTGRAVFRPGSINSRMFSVKFPVDGGLKLYFDYAIDASWAPPVPNPPIAIPGDFPMKANSPEAFLVKMSIEENTLGASIIGGVGSGELKLSMDIWDWQGWAYGSYADQIGDIEFYSPSIDFMDPQIAPKVNGNGVNLGITVEGYPTQIGTVPVLIMIPAPGTNWKQSPSTAPTGEIAAYSIINVEVTELTCSGDQNVVCDDAVELAADGSIGTTVCMPYDPTDYYMFQVPSDSLYQGTISLNNFDYCDNDLILYDGCPGDPINTSMQPGTTNEVIDVGSIEEGNYYIAVLPGETAGTDVQPYKLQLDLEKISSTCTTDSNNDYTAAVMIGLEDSKSGTVCAGDDVRDWYGIVIASDKVAGGGIIVYNGGNGNIDIRIYDVYPGPVTWWGTNDGTQDESVQIDGIGPGTHYIEVYSAGSSPLGDRGYILETGLFTSGFSCTGGDGNDSPLTADPIGLTEAVSGTICFPADPDWFVFTIGENMVANGSIVLSGENMVDNDLYVYQNPSGDPIAVSANIGTMDESVSLDELAEGSYYVKCIAHPYVGGGDQPYTLTMGLTSVKTALYIFHIHAHIICQNDGTKPATTESKVQADVAWADEFYSQWEGKFILSEISYINKTSWLAATGNEVQQCHQLYGDKSGPINVYYVNSFPDMTNAAAWCRMDCRYYYQNHNSTYIAMSDYAANRVLAHELGHATGIFQDVYLLDAGFSSCNQIYQYFCPYSPNNSFCKESDADYGNLMWFMIENWNDPEDYWLSDKNWNNPSKPIESQVENWSYFNTNYPNNFP
ncbi:MAG: hypothetical protein ABIC40_04505 [bacterium]